MVTAHYTALLLGNIPADTLLEHIIGALPTSGNDRVGYPLNS